MPQLALRPETLTFTRAYTIRRAPSEHYRPDFYGVYGDGDSTATKLGTQTECVAYCERMSLQYVLQ